MVMKRFFEGIENFVDTMRKWRIDSLRKSCDRSDPDKMQEVVRKIDIINTSAFLFGGGQSCHLAALDLYREILASDADEGVKKEIVKSIASICSLSSHSGKATELLRSVDVRQFSDKDTLRLIVRRGAAVDLSDEDSARKALEYIRGLPYGDMPYDAAFMALNEILKIQKNFPALNGEILQLLKPLPWARLDNDFFTGAVYVLGKISESSMEREAVEVLVGLPWKDMNKDAQILVAINIRNMITKNPDSGQALAESFSAIPWAEIDEVTQKIMLQAATLCGIHENGKYAGKIREIFEDLYRDVQPSIRPDILDYSRCLATICGDHMSGVLLGTLRHLQAEVGGERNAEIMSACREVFRAATDPDFIVAMADAGQDKAADELRTVFLYAADFKRCIELGLSGEEQKLFRESAILLGKLRDVRDLRGRVFEVS